MKLHLFLVLGLHLICSSSSSSTALLRLQRQGNYYSSSNNNNNNAQSTYAEPRVTIEDINVQCSNAGLYVSVQFDGPFYGVIYSRGHFGNSRCRYQEAEQSGPGSQALSFTVPSDDCGTENIDGTVSNVIIFQMDATVQHGQDIARKVSCDLRTGVNKPTSKKIGKTVVFKPLSVGMLDVQNQPFKSEGIDCWMDIQLGEFPNTTPIDGQVKIGEALSVIIHLKDDKKMYDLAVKDCWAFNNEDFDNPSTSKVQLTDNDGCTRKTKLIGSWKKSTEPTDYGTGAIVYTNMTAFKFPDSDNVHLTCNVEVCEEYCEETCASNAGGIVPPSRRPVGGPVLGQLAGPDGPSYGAAPEFSTPSSRQTTIPPPICYPNNFDPRCPKETQVSDDLSPSTRPPYESEDDVLPGGYTRPTTRMPICYPGSADERCYEEKTDIQPGYTTQRPYTYQTTQRPYSYTTYPTQTTQRPRPLCYPGQIDPRCPPVCMPGSTDPRCNEEEDEVLPGGFTTRRPTTRVTTSGYSYPRPTTTQPPRPYPTTTRAPTTQFRCYPGSLDPRCLRGPTTTQRPYTHNTTPSSPAICSAGSTDPRCNEEEDEVLPGGFTTRRPTPTTSYQRPVTTTQPATARPSTTYRCYPGSLDYRCLPQTTTTPTYYTPTTTKKVLCYPGQIDPRCPPVCHEGSTDRRCKQREEEDDVLPGGFTTQRPFTYPTTTTTTTQRYQYQQPTTPRTAPTTTTRKPLCYPGQIDPRCPPVCTPGSTDPRCNEDEDEVLPGGFTTQRPFTYPTTNTRRYQYQQPTTPRTVPTTKKPLCYPGQIDPRCPPVCTPGSTDPRCNEEEDEVLPGGFTTQRPFTYPTTTTRRYQYQQPTTQRTAPTSKKPLCYPGQIDPRCPPVCTPGSTDPRCNEEEDEVLPGKYTTQRPYTTTRRYQYQQPTTTRTAPTTKKPLCYPGQIDPRCPPVCTPGSTDRRCNEEEDEVLPGGFTTQRPFMYPTTTTTRRYQYQQPTTPRTAPTTKKPLCYPGQIDPRCPPVCTPGSTDPRCGEEEDEVLPGGFTTKRPAATQRTTTQPPRTIPTTRRTTPTTPFQCYPGSLDPKCLRRTTQPYTTTRAPPPEFTITTHRPTTPQLRLTTTTTKKPLCYPGQIDPRCPPVCYKGSTDRRCKEEEDDVLPGGFTTRRPTTQPPRTIPTTTRAPTTQFRCYPGSLDPRCLRGPTTTQRSYTTTPHRRPPAPTRPTCYPGSTDLGCIEEDEVLPGGFTTRKPTTPQRTTSRPFTTTTRKPVCGPGSTDPRCNEDEDEDDVLPGQYKVTTRRPTSPIPSGYMYAPPKNPLRYPEDSDQQHHDDLRSSASASIGREFRARQFMSQFKFKPLQRSASDGDEDYVDHQKYLGFESKRIFA